MVHIKYAFLTEIKSKHCKLCSQMDWHDKLFPVIVSNTRCDHYCESLVNYSSWEVHAKPQQFPFLSFLSWHMQEWHSYVKVDVGWEAQKQSLPLISPTEMEVLAATPFPPLQTGSRTASRGRAFLSPLEGVSPETPRSFGVKLETRKDGTFWWLLGQRVIP